MENDRISGDQGSIKPEETITDIVRKVAYNRDADEAPMRAAANGALVRWLKELEDSDSEDDQRIVGFALEQHGFDSVNELAEAMFEAGEPIMAARKNLEDLDPEEIGLDDSGFESELQEPEEGGDGA